MSAVTDFLAQLRVERDSLAGRVAALDNLIPQLERYQELFSADARPVPVPVAVTSKRIEPRKVERSLPAAQNRDEHREQEILACLKPGPKSTGKIASELQADQLVTRNVLKRLLKAKMVVSTGSTNQQRWSLVSTVPTNGKTLAAVVHKGDGPACVRCRHRFAMHDPSTGACTPPCICREFYA